MSGSIFCIMCRTLLYGSGRLPTAPAVSLPGILGLSFSSMLFQPCFVRNTGKELPAWRIPAGLRKDDSSQPPVRSSHCYITSQVDEPGGGAFFSQEYPRLAG